MAKKKPESQVPNKSIDDMTDVEFITSADYLSSPYYRAYMNAKSRVGSESWEQQDYYQPASYQPTGQQSSRTAVKKQRDSSVKPSKAAALPGTYVKKRGFALFLIMLLMLVVLAVSVLSVVEIEAISDFIPAFIKPGVIAEQNENIGILDPAIGLVKKFVSALDMDSIYYDNYLANIPDDAKILTTITLYAVPAVAIILTLCALIGFIKAIAALASKAKNGAYKKFKFGFLSIVMLLSGAIMLVGGLFACGMEISDIMDFALQKSTTLYAGYGLYAAVVLPILTLILSCISYKKAK